MLAQLICKKLGALWPVLRMHARVCARICTYMCINSRKCMYVHVCRCVCERICEYMRNTSVRQPECHIEERVLSRVQLVFFCQAVALAKPHGPHVMGRLQPQSYSMLALLRGHPLFAAPLDARNSREVC